MQDTLQTPGRRPVVDPTAVRAAAVGRGLQAAIADLVEAEIDAGRLRVGDRLPAVRTLAAGLEVAGATVSAAYDLLARRGRVRGEVGRGTFVTAASGSFETAAPPFGAPPSPTRRPPLERGEAGGASLPAPAAPWRRRLMTQSAARLHALHPAAADCASGAPDPALLPFAALRSAYAAALASLRPDDLQYGTADPSPELASAVGRRLAAEGVAGVAGDQVAVGSSALQLVDLGLRAAARRNGWRCPIVAVERPGYATALDQVDRLGWPALGVDVDAEGAVPASLEAALRQGARIVLLTPRAHNPTGASWTAERAAALADVLAAVPDAVAIEDDHAAGICSAGALTLLADPRTASRTIHVRSFSKAYAPDLRIAVAVSSASVRALIVDEKGYVDGWTSRLAQRVLARLLDDPDLASILDHARDAYARRRAAALEALSAGGLRELGGEAVPAADGLNLWVRVPAGADENLVLERAAAAGCVATPGEAFNLRPGHSGAVRLTVSLVDEAGAAAAGTALARAVTEAVTARCATAIT